MKKHIKILTTATRKEGPEIAAGTFKKIPCKLGLTSEAKCS